MDYKSLPEYLEPYATEPRHSDLLSVVQSTIPFNSEPPVDSLIEFERTPEELVYERNHSAVKQFNEETYEVRVLFEGFGQVVVPMAQLRHEFKKERVVATLQCAGNRRSLMSSIKPVHGVPWKEGVIANCQWGGISVRTLLRHVAGQAGVDLAANAFKHVRFGSHSMLCEDDAYYGASLPMSHVMDTDMDVLLCYELNNGDLSPAHGGPLRLVVPGYLGARWVKWVDAIVIGYTEDPNYYMARDYKILPASVETKADALPLWPKYPAMTSLPLNSVVATTTRMSSSTLYVKGYAIADPFPAKPGDQFVNVTRVEVSVDSGKTWTPSQIIYQEGKWAWTLWEATLSVTEAGGQVCSRAVDSVGNVQPETGCWNLRGVAWCGWGRASFE